MAASSKKHLDLEALEGGEGEDIEHCRGVNDANDVDGHKEEDLDTEDNSSITSGKEQSENTFSIIQGKSKVVFVKDNISEMYKCHLCKYETVNRKSMRSHCAVHSTARPYACDLCPYEAKRLCDLKKHKVLKHGKTLKSLRNNQWRGSLGSAALKKDQLHYKDMLSLDSPSLEGIELDTIKVMSRTRSGIPIEIIEDDDEDEDISFLDDSAFVNDTNHLLANPVFAETNPTNSNERSLNTPSCSKCSAHQINEDIKMSDKEPEHGMIPADLIKTEPGEFVDYFSKRYFEGMNGAESEIDLQNTFTMHRKESGYNSGPQSPYDKLEESERASSASSGPSNNMPKRKNISGSSLLKKSRLLFSQPHQKTNECSNDNLIQSSQFAPVLCREKTDTDDPSHSDAKSWKCPYCVIVFYDSALYFMHMGLHNGRDPWKCNLCGNTYHDVYGFTSHFVNGHANSC